MNTDAKRLHRLAAMTSVAFLADGAKASCRAANDDERRESPPAAHPMRPASPMRRRSDRGTRLAARPPFRDRELWVKAAVWL